MSVAVVVVVVVVSIKIARSRDLGIYECCKHKESVDICEKLVSVCFELLNMAHKHCTNHASSVQHACGLPTAPTLICSMCFLLMHIATTQVSR